MNSKFGERCHLHKFVNDNDRNAGGLDSHSITG